MRSTYTRTASPSSSSRHCAPILSHRRRLLLRHLMMMSTLTMPCCSLAVIDWTLQPPSETAAPEPRLRVLCSSCKLVLEPLGSGKPAGRGEGRQPLTVARPMVLIGFVVVVVVAAAVIDRRRCRSCPARRPPCRKAPATLQLPTPATTTWTASDLIRRRCPALFLSFEDHKRDPYNNRNKKTSINKYPIIFSICLEKKKSKLN